MASKDPNPFKKCKTLGDVAQVERDLKSSNLWNNETELQEALQRIKIVSDLYNLEEKSDSEKDEENNQPDFSSAHKIVFKGRYVSITETKKTNVPKFRTTGIDYKLEFN